MNYENWKVVIQRELARLGVRMYIYRHLPDGATEIVASLDSGKVERLKEEEEYRGFYLPEPVFMALVDAIHKDHKPSEGKFTEGKLVATEKHLEDMRALLKLK